LTNKTRVTLAGLVLLSAAFRLVGLTALPPFLDESWYMSWSLKIGSGMSVVRPWLAGKGVPIVVNALVLPWADGHELAASRALTVAFSLLTVAALFALARRLYGERTAAVAALFYVACPFALFHDRLFLADAVLTAFVALALVASCDLARHGRARDGALAGLALALAVLSKANGALLLFVPAAAWLAFARPLRHAWRALAVAYAVAILLVAVPLWVFLERTGAMRVAFSGPAAPPLDRTVRNLAQVGEWLWVWGTAPLCVLALAGIAAALALRHAPSLFLAAVALVPVAVLVPTATTWYPRYLHFVAVPALVLAAHALVSLVELVLARRGLSAFARGAVLAAAAAAVLVPSLANDVRLWTDPRRAPMPAVDRFQYVTGWPSGYGVRETVARVKEERARRPEGLTIVIRSRAMPATQMALSVAFRRDAGVRIEDLPLGEPARALPLLEKWARERPTVVVATLVDGGPRLPSGTWGRLGVELVAETHKPDGQPCDAIYRVRPLEAAPAAAGRTTMGIVGDAFHIDGRPTLERASTK
jgi:4-amino-4-deoxy-L-arabinose transferase-like glycosyltransferase